MSAMEVLPRALAAHVHCSSLAGRPTCSPTRLPPLASILASSYSLLVSSVSASLALNYKDFVKGLDSLYDFNVAESFFFTDFNAAMDFMTANPMAFLVGLAAVTVPLIAFTALAIPHTFGSMSAAEGFEKLAQPNAQLLHIHVDGKVEGLPNLKSLGKNVVHATYNKGDDAEAFVAKVVAKFKDPATTTLYILDREDRNSLEVVKLLANNGFEGAFAIKGGVEGPIGWKDTSSLVPSTLGVAAVANIGATFFTEQAESALQLLGSAALIQIFIRKFMFAKSCKIGKKTIKDLATFLDTKIAPNNFANELKEVGRVLLPKNSEVNAVVESGGAVLEEKSKIDSVSPEAVIGKAA